MERFSIIPEHPNYAISDFGRVLNIQRDHFMGGSIEKRSGYRYVTLGGRPKFVHRLVALAFLEKKWDSFFVYHKDGDKLNNRFENLEWSTICTVQMHTGELPYNFTK